MEILFGELRLARVFANQRSGIERADLGRIPLDRQTFGALEDDLREFRRRRGVDSELGTGGGRGGRNAGARDRSAYDRRLRRGTGDNTSNDAAAERTGAASDDDSKS